METLLRDQVANGTVVINRLPRQRLSDHCAQHARRSRCHCLTVATTDQRLEMEDVRLARFVLTGPCPGLALQNDADAHVTEGEDALTCWTMALESWLQTCL